MQVVKGRSPLRVSVLIICALAFCTAARAQKPTQTKSPEPADDVVRVNTALVQTDVTVVDKHGHVITGLKPETFELRVDSKPRPLSFFEEILTGGPEEEKQLKNAREGKTVTTPTSTTSRELANGQLIFFFVDDVHLAGEGWARARSLLLNF